jgi:hypothetical protein
MRMPMIEMQLLDVRCSIYCYHKALSDIRPATRREANIAISMMNRMRVIPTDTAATPPKQNIAATIETTRKNRADHGVTGFHSPGPLQQHG